MSSSIDFSWSRGEVQSHARNPTHKTGVKLLTLNCVASAPSVMGITGMPLHSETYCATTGVAAHRKERRRRRKETRAAAARALATRIAEED